MKIANLADVKNQLSRYVDHVRRGGRVRILVRGTAAADLVPVSVPSGETTMEESRLQQLEREGILRRGRGRLPNEVFRPGPSGRGRTLAQIVIEERRSSR